MKLFHSPLSPYVRKCMVIAIELGLTERLEIIAGAANPITRDQNIVVKNPLGKVPTLVTDDGVGLYDSRVICEYLNDLGGGKLLPASGHARWQILTEQSLGDGILDAALLARYETFMRPEALRWAEWTKGQLEKVHSGLAVIEANAAKWGEAFDLGKITLGCALGYLDLRFPSIDWRAQYPQAAAWFAKFNARPSMQATVPKA
jgi:glutathione S-transferase